MTTVRIIDIDRVFQRTRAGLATSVYSLSALVSGVRAMRSHRDYRRRGGAITTSNVRGMRSRTRSADVMRPGDSQSAWGARRMTPRAPSARG
jgi:hypothetical protein